MPLGAPRIRLIVGGGSRELEASLRGLDVIREPDADSDLVIVTPEGMTRLGLAGLRDLQARSRELPAIAVLPDDVEPDRVRDCLRDGAAEVLFQSELPHGLRPALERTLAEVRGRARHEARAQRLAEELGKRASELEDALGAVRDAYDQTLAALVTALDHRERETACHSQRVALYALLLGMRVGVEEEPLQDLYRGALLHDIGKIAIPDAILLKPGRLDEAEWRIMRRHTELGAQLVAKISFLRGASEVPLAHHEAWDGSGYPRGLAGGEIPLHARIFAIVDTYDAIRSHRPYKPPREHPAAVAALEDAAGSRLDPALVGAFVAEPAAHWEHLSGAVERDGTWADALALCLRLRGG